MNTDIAPLLVDTLQSVLFCARYIQLNVVHDDEIVEKSPISNSGATTWRLMNAVLSKLVSASHQSGSHWNCDDDNCG